MLKYFRKLFLEGFNFFFQKLQLIIFCHQKNLQHLANDPNLSCTIRALSFYFYFYAQEIILNAISANLIHHTVLGNKLLDDAFENKIFVTNFHRYLGGSILVMLRP